MVNSAADFQPVVSIEHQAGSDGTTFLVHVHLPFHDGQPLRNAAVSQPAIHVSRASGPEATTFNQFEKRFMDAKQNRLKQRSIRAYLFHLRHFRKKFSRLDCLQEVTPQIAVDYVNARAETVNAETANTILLNMRVLFNFAVKQGMIGKNPFQNVERFKVLPRKINTITYTQEQCLLSTVERMKKCACDKLKNKAIIKLALEGGLRNSEIRHLRWKDINLHTGEVQLTCRESWTTKNGRNRTSFVFEDALSVLRELRQHIDGDDETMPFHCTESATLSRAFKRIAVRAGVTCTLHDLRRTAASRIVEAGHSLLMASEYIGDLTQTVTRKHYVRISESTLRKAGLDAAEHARNGIHHPTMEDSGD